MLLRVMTAFVGCVFSLCGWLLSLMHTQLVLPLVLGWENGLMQAEESLKAFVSS